MSGTLNLQGTPPLVMPTGAAAGYVLTTDSSGNVSPQPTGEFPVAAHPGADNTGATDSSAAVYAAQAAATAAGGGYVVFGPGTWKFSTITLAAALNGSY